MNVTQFFGWDFESGKYYRTVFRVSGVLKQGREHYIINKSYSRKCPSDAPSDGEISEDVCIAGLKANDLACLSVNGDRYLWPRGRQNKEKTPSFWDGGKKKGENTFERSSNRASDEASQQALPGYSGS